jgi:REP element-mobilizing transposase RayT
VWACSILPEHIHLVTARHGYPVEQIVNHLKGAATRQLRAEEVHPLAAYGTRTGRVPKAFERGEWKVFLDNASDIARAIHYVEQNPVKERKPVQHWRFVRPFDPRCF